MNDPSPDERPLTSAGEAIPKAQKRKEEAGMNTGSGEAIASGPVRAPSGLYRLLRVFTVIHPQEAVKALLIWIVLCVFIMKEYKRLKSGVPEAASAGIRSLETEAAPEGGKSAEPAS